MNIPITGPITGPITDRRIFGALAVLIAGGITAACLWPFHAPKNDVSWLKNRDGLEFGRYGTVMSSGSFELPASADDRGWSLEIWMHASRMKARRHFLTVYSPESTNQLSLRQYANGVVLSTEDKREEYTPTDESIYVGDVFRPTTRVLLSITAGRHRTSVFVDGVLRKSSEVLRLSRHALSGQIVLGDAPRATDSWPGWIGGLAVYGRELSPTEESQHFEDWNRDQPPALNDDERPAALYLFNERAGNTVRNQVPAGVDLTIPERYTVAGKLFLEAPLHEYDPIWSYYKSILFNIVGFLPFGFLWCGYLSLCFPRRRTMTVLTTVILGGAFSLTMEILQAFLPTRGSGIADIITNTTGTILGAAAYRLSEEAVQRFWSRVGVTAAASLDPISR